jgi:hypothetical protein
VPAQAHGAAPRRHPWRLHTGAAAASAAALLAAVLISAAPTSGAERVAGALLISLSNQRTLTRWAYPSLEATIRSSPSASSRAIGRLRFLTSDQQAQLYVALAATQLSSGIAWVRVEVPGRPNGQTGWVPRDALGSFHVVRDLLLVDRTRLLATLDRNGRAIFSAPVGVGKASTATPAGSFYVTEKLVTVGAPVYGPYAIGTSAYAPTLSEWPGGGVVGIHGTSEPQLIPGRPSHGCIRMRNADITRLWHLIGAGTPIRVI